MAYHILRIFLTLMRIPLVYGSSAPLGNFLLVYHKNVPMIIQSLGSNGYPSLIYSLIVHSITIHSRLCSYPLYVVGRSAYRSAHNVPLQIVLFHFHCFSSGTLSNPRWIACVSLLYFDARRSLWAPFWLFAFATFVRLLACCLLPALLPFSFLRCLLPVGCRFLPGFCLASYRGAGVECEAPHLRSISPNFPDGFCALLIFYVCASTGLHGGLVSWYLLSLLLMMRRYSSRKRNNRPLAQSPSERSILS